MTLNEAQVLTLRMLLHDAISRWSTEGLGDDEHGRDMVRLYTARAREMLAIFPHPSDRQAHLGREAATVVASDLLKQIERLRASATNALDAIDSALHFSELSGRDFDLMRQAARGLEDALGIQERACQEQAGGI